MGAMGVVEKHRGVEILSTVLCVGDLIAGHQRIVEGCFDK
jgi:hypothetical protein